MADVVDIRPDVSAERIIDPHYIQCRIEQMLSECSKLGIPTIVVLWAGHTATFCNPEAHAHDTLMMGALDKAKDFVQGLVVEMQNEPEEENEK